MKEKILDTIRGILGKDLPIELSVPEAAVFGHYSTNVAMRVASRKGPPSQDSGEPRKPLDLAQEFAATIAAKAPAGFFEKVEAAAPGFVNFWLSKETIQEELQKVVGDDRYGMSDTMKGKTVMVEFTDPNPFKLFHIGHLMSNTIGESFARLYEVAGAKVIRANYQGDVGLHIAMAVWAMQHEVAGSLPSEQADLREKVEYLGRAYAVGSSAYSSEAEPNNEKAEIAAINEKIYSRRDPEINKFYDIGRAWSLAYFEISYARLGTKFDHYFFESEIGKDGLEIVLAHKNIFEESQGAIIFPGEKYGLHTRVFVNARGLPTYEAKELGLNKKKFELYPLDLSVIITANEIDDYFKVLLKAMELVIPDVAAKTRHVSHGLLRLPTGKMSSRKGDVVTADALLDQVKVKLMERVSERADELSSDERAAATEIIAVGAIKYSILKQSPGQDIIFDFDKSLSFEGDSGPYLQYAYARLKSILRKASLDEAREINTGEGENYSLSLLKGGLVLLNSEYELALMRKIFEFPDIVLRAGEILSSSGLANYLYKLAVAANKFYETTPILKDENEERRTARLVLVDVAAQTLKSGLELLGIKTLEKI